MEDKERYWVDWAHQNIINHPFSVSGARTQSELCKRYYHGDQYQRIDPISGKITQVNIKRDIKAVYNFIQINGKAFVSKMYANDPVPQTEPPQWNNSFSAVEVCDVGNAILQYFWDKLNIRRTLRNGSTDGYQTGIGWVKVQLERGEKIAEVKDLMSDEEIQKSGLKEESFYEADISVTRCNPLYVYPDPIATKQEELRWVIYEWRWPKKMVAETLGVDPDDIPDGDERTELTGIEQKRASEEDETLHYKDENDPMVIVREIFHLPSPDLENGAHVWVVADKQFDLLSLPGMLDRVERMKYFCVSVNPNENRLRGDGYTEMQLPAQRSYNKAKSLAEEAMRMAVTKWIVDTNSNVSKITDGVDVIKYTNTGNTSAPHQSQISPLPAHLIQMPDANLNAIKFITGMADPNFGVIPMRGSQTSGTVIRELKDATAQLHSADISEHKVWHANIAREILILVQKNFSREQVEKIVGKDKGMAIDLFMSDETDWVNGYGIVIRIGDGYAHSASSRFDEFMQLAQLGPQYMPPVLLLRAYGNYFSWSDFLKPFTQSRKTAKNILFEILNAKTTEDLAAIPQLYFSEADDHSAHLEVFTEWLQSSERFSLMKEEMGVEKVETVKAYANLCQQMLAQQAMAAAQPQQGGAANPRDAAIAEENMRKAQGQPTEQPQGDLNV